MKLIIRSFCLLFSLHSFSQTDTNQEKIKNYIETYFNADREIIHVQFNKNTYTNNEDLAFKGYVWSKNNSIPNIYTSNVQLIIYNEKEEIIQKQLLFTNKGTFAGGIHLNDKFKTGKYYFHFYTNWMNNFTEDDSFIKAVQIIDKNDSYNFDSAEPNWKSAAVTIHPEGGVIINDLSNTIGVSIKDCNKKGIETDGIITDSKSNEITSFHTNKMGNSAFYFVPKINETYTLKIKSDKLTISQVLPKVQETGIIVTYNNNLPNNRLIINVKTNEKGLELYQNKKFTLVIQQDEKSVPIGISFSKGPEQTMIVDKQKLSYGVNSIRLLDEDLNEITERLLYIAPPASRITNIEAKAMANDSITLLGKTEINKTNLSISVLPENSSCVSQKSSILGTFYLNAYLENPETDNYVYFDPENKESKQQMELLMLNQNKSKFHWNEIKSNPPKLTHTFDKGVTIKGTISNFANSASKNSVVLFSLKNVAFDKTPVDKDGHFKFENFFAQDSTVFILEAMNEKSGVMRNKIQANVFPNQTMFPLPMKFDHTVCPAEKRTDNIFAFKKLPLEKKTITLNDVIIQNNAKKALKHEADMSSFATGYKIQDNDFEKVLDYIGRNGYSTGTDPQTGDVYIRSNRTINLGDSAAPPTVYVDNVELFDLNYLFSLSLTDVDEIYIDQSGSSDLSTRGHGTIKIFLKDPNSMKKFITVKYTTMIAKNGFTPNIKYETKPFASQEEFNLFGTLNWSPYIMPKDNSNFEIKFPKDNQKEVQILVEGFSDDGQLISEIKKVPVAN